ncbi:hypothetical protein DH2020_014584 [Rehmannia glutinosa]|uniref:GRF-type domain-containing protein n=1 Tax=Rehmannia glutinosa TaxID=99300 RepID=A0ABR0X064_REHGL
MSYVTGEDVCHCGTLAVIRTSWTTDNPGRRFQSCRQFDRGGCSFFAWKDPPMCRRAKAIIPGLLKRINDMCKELEKMELNEQKISGMEHEIEKLKRKNRMLVNLLVVLPLFVVLYIWVWKALNEIRKCQA